MAPGSGHITLPLDTVADDHGLFDQFVVRFEADVDGSAAGRDDPGLPDITDGGIKEDATGGNLDGVISIQVRGDSVGSALLDDGRADHRLVRLVKNPSVDCHLGLRPGAERHEDEQASERLRSGTIPDIILCEITLPEARGIRLCKTVRSGSRTRHIPFLFLGTEVKAELQVEGLEAGADACLDVPFSPAYLQALIRSLLRNRQLARGEWSCLHEILGLNPSTMSAADQLFLSDLEEILRQDLDNPELGVSKLASRMNMSRSKLYYRTKEISGISPNELIRHYRLEIAEKILREGKRNVSETAFSVGISSLSYFSKAFKKQFGILPRDALRK